MSDARLQELHDSQKGRVFVLGTGPSLIDQLPLLAKLKNEATFACNSLPRWELLPFEPTYYGVTDIRDQRLLDPLAFPHLKNTVRFQVAWRGWYTRPEFIFVEKHEADQMHNVGFKGLDGTLEPVPTARTSPLTLAQVAAWMGYREFYFLGIEQTRGYCYEPSAMMSFTERAEFPLDKNVKYQIGIQRCAQRMREDIEAAGGKVYDCSFGGLLNRTNNVDRGPLRCPAILEYRELAEVLT